MTDNRTLRKALGCFSTGVTVVTTIDESGGPVGVTVSSFTSVSLEPPLVLFCLDHRNSNLAAFKASGHFVINVLRHEQRELSMRFASRVEDKWAAVAHSVWDRGAPVLQGCLANFECETVAVEDHGDHAVFIGKVTRLEYAQAGQPLIYFRGAYAESGATV